MVIKTTVKASEKVIIIINTHPLIHIKYTHTNTHPEYDYLLVKTHKHAQSKKTKKKIKILIVVIWESGDNKTIIL